MGDWLHCNTCFSQPGDGRCYFLTMCGHIFCDKCEERGWKERCLTCGTNQPSALKLTSKMSPPVDAYLSEPLMKIKEICKDIKQLEATTEFQHHQRKRFNAHLQKKSAQQKIVISNYEQELKRFYTNVEYLRRENSKLKEENNYLKRLLSEKSHGNFHRSPSGDRNRSPVRKGVPLSSPVPMQHGSRSSSLSSLTSHGHNSSSGRTVITSGRISVRTPPSGGRIGTIPKYPVTPDMFIHRNTPKSVPHPVPFDISMETPPPPSHRM